MGFTANRLNVFITGLQASGEIYHVHKWSELAPTVMVHHLCCVRLPVRCHLPRCFTQEAVAVQVDDEGRGDGSLNSYSFLPLSPRGPGTPGLSFKQKTSSRNASQ